jgi:hypothetical protein
MQKKLLRDPLVIFSTPPSSLILATIVGWQRITSPLYAHSIPPCMPPLLSLSPRRSPSVPPPHNSPATPCPCCTSPCRGRAPPQRLSLLPCSLGTAEPPLSLRPRRVPPARAPLPWSVSLRQRRRNPLCNRLCVREGRRSKLFGGPHSAWTLSCAQLTARSLLDGAHHMHACRSKALACRHSCFLHASGQRETPTHIPLTWIFCVLGHVALYVVYSFPAIKLHHVINVNPRNANYLIYFAL